MLPGSCNTRRYAWLLTLAAPLTILHDPLSSLSLSLFLNGIFSFADSQTFTGSRSFNRHPAIKRSRLVIENLLPFHHYSLFLRHLWLHCIDDVLIFSRLCRGQRSYIRYTTVNLFRNFSTWKVSEFTWWRMKNLGILYNILSSTMIPSCRVHHCLRSA